MDPALLVIENLSCGYGAGDVLRGVNLSVTGGEFVGVLGANGAGKSTLFRAACGALAPREGRVLVRGVNLDALKPRELARRMALAPQILEVPFSFTVHEFVSLGRLPHLGRFGSPSAADRESVARSEAFMHLDALADRALHSLSGGERQRTVIAQALAQEPEILLLDEPAAHLDLKHQVEVFELLDRVRSKGVAVLAVLHDPNLASEYCTRIVLLREGRVFADGAPGEVITPDLIQGALGILLDVAPDPVSGRPHVHFRRSARPAPGV